MNATERRERLIRILTLRGRTTVRELAIGLEVSERTILRDVDILSTNQPISAIAGRGGGVYILDTYKDQIFYLPDLEIKLLKKILAEIDRCGSYTPTTAERKLLQEMILLYQKPIKGKEKNDESK